MRASSLHHARAFTLKGMRSPFSPILTPQFPVCQPYMRIQPAFAGTFRAFYADEQLRRRADSARVFNIRLRKVPLANTVRRTYNRHRSRCAGHGPGGWGKDEAGWTWRSGVYVRYALRKVDVRRLYRVTGRQGTSAPRMFGKPCALSSSDARTQPHRPPIYIGGLPAQGGSQPVAPGGPVRQAPSSSQAGHPARPYIGNPSRTIRTYTYSIMRPGAALHAPPLPHRPARRRNDIRERRNANEQDFT